MADPSWCGAVASQAVKAPSRRARLTVSGTSAFFQLWIRVVVSLQVSAGLHGAAICILLMSSMFYTCQLSLESNRTGILLMLRGSPGKVPRRAATGRTGRWERADILLPTQCLRVTSRILRAEADVILDPPDPPSRLRGPFPAQPAGRIGRPSGLLTDGWRSSGNWQ